MTVHVSSLDVSFLYVIKVRNQRNDVLFLEALCKRTKYVYGLIDYRHERNDESQNDMTNIIQV